MSKMYRTSGVGANQQTLDVNDEKIKIYADDTALDADLANIGENEIVATTEQSFPSSFAGMVVAFAGAEAPLGWLLCDGSAVSRSLYSALFDVIGTMYGVGDGSSTFNLPDYRECVLVGTGNNDTDAIASHDTYTLGQFKDDQNKAHHHTIYGRTSGGSSSMSNSYPITTYGLIGHASSNLDYTETTTAGGSTKNIIGDAGEATAHGKQKGVNYIIKY